MKVNLKIDRELNFLMIIYQIIKGQNKFENLKFENTGIFAKEDRTKIKKYLRKEIDFETLIQDSGKYEGFYKKNRLKWDSYWQINFNKLKKSIKYLQKKVDDYDFSVFDKVEKFYEVNGPKTVDVWVCMGNENIYGTGNAFNPNQCVIFLREFNLEKEKNLDHDFAVLIHEVFHLFQGIGQKKDNDFYEKVANCFAPRGILIGKEPTNSFLYDEIKKAFDENQAYLSFEKAYLEKEKGGVSHGE